MRFRVVPLREGGRLLARFRPRMHRAILSELVLRETFDLQVRRTVRPTVLLDVATGLGLAAPAPLNLRPNLAARQARASDFAHRLSPLFETMCPRGLSQRGMAEELNRIGVPTARGALWRLSQVQRVLLRLPKYRKAQSQNSSTAPPKNAPSYKCV